MTANCVSGSFPINGRPVLIIVHRSANPAPEEWDRYLDLYKSRLEQLSHSNGELLGNLVFSDGGGPSVRQRKQTLDLISHYTTVRIKSAVITESAIGRGIVTAFAWIGGSEMRQIKPFASSRILEVAEFAEIPATSLTDLAEALQQMHKSLPAAVLERSISNLEKA